MGRGAWAYTYTCIHIHTLSDTLPLTRSWPDYFSLSFSTALSLVGMTVASTSELEAQETISVSTQMERKYSLNFLFVETLPICLQCFTTVKTLAVTLKICKSQLSTASSCSPHLQALQPPGLRQQTAVLFTQSPYTPAEEHLSLPFPSFSECIT